MRRFADVQARTFPVLSEQRVGAGFAHGLEPPINAERLRETPTGPRRISFKWLTGTVLTGLLGAALVAAAVYAALDEQTHFAEPPQKATAARQAADTDADEGPRTGDRILQPVEFVGAKQTFKTPTTIKVGDKEVVRQKEFTRVATTLTLTDTGEGADVPPIASLKTQADSKTPELAPDPGPATDDAEVSFVARAIDPAETSDPTRTLSLEEVQAQVTEHLKNAIAASNRPALPLPPQLLLMRTSRAGLDINGSAYADPDAAPINSPFSSIEVRMVPENVTSVVKGAADGLPRQTEQKLVTVRHGMSLEGILKANGTSPQRIKAIVAAFGRKPGESPVNEGQKVKLSLVDLDATGRAMQVARIAIYTDEKIGTIVAMNDAGAFVQISDSAVRTAKAQNAKGGANTGGLRLYESLYESALKQSVSKPVINQLVKVFSNDVDFQRPVGNGDSFDTFYANAETADGHDELLYASITTHGETYRYYRFQTPDDAMVDFYDPTGRSTRKFLIRKPMAGGEATSPFGYRTHPVLGYARMHTGQDWAAPPGSQIFAAGNGTIIKAGWSAGYGRRVEIQHPHDYVTTYSHMSGFARGIAEGQRVRQGQLIGYVGTTGLSTGPHLHYEVLINSRFVDPMGIKLPRTREFDGRLLGIFKRERERIDGLMAKAPTGDIDTGQVADVTH